MREAEKIFKALADWNRLRILKMLEAKPMCGCGIAHVLGIAQSTISRHLSILSDAQLIIGERDGNYILYSLSTFSVSRIALKQLKFLRGWLDDDSQIISDKRSAYKIDKCDFE